MPKSMTLNVRVSGSLGEFVVGNVSDTGIYKNISEYVRDLIRKDKARVERKMFERLKAELKTAFITPDTTYETMTAQDIITRNTIAQNG